MTPTMPTAADLLPLLPELVLVGAAFALLMLDLFLDERRRIVTHVLSIGVLLVVAAMIGAGVGGQGAVLNGMFLRDGMADVLKVTVCVVTALSLVYAWSYLRERRLYQGEVPVLMLFAVAGMMLLISAGSLVMVYLGLEMLALCSYALVAIDRDSPLASEAAMKYFVLGSLASGMLLYGMSLLYGATGTLDLAQIHAAVATVASPTCCSPAWCSWSPASHSSSAPRRSTCGCPISTRAHRRRSRCSSGRRRNWPLSRWHSACSKPVPARSTNVGDC